MAHYSKRALLANIFGTFGYVSCLMLWMWTAVLYLPALLNNEQIRDMLLPSGETAVTVPPPPEALSPIMIAFALGITAIVIAVTVFVLLRAPVTIARTGNTVTKKAAGSLEPLIVRGRVLPPREKRKLTVTLIKLVKLLLVLLPVAAGFLSVLLPPALPYEIVMLISCAVAITAVFWFSAQYIAADMLSVKPEKLI